MKKKKYTFTNNKQSLYFCYSGHKEKVFHDKREKALSRKSVSNLRISIGLKSVTLGYRI